MKHVLYLLDTGATHARLVAGPPDAPLADMQRFDRKVDSVEALLSFVGETVEAYEGAVNGRRSPTRVLVGGFAGVRSPQGVVMTNWADRELSLKRLRALGMHDIHLMNDLEAAAHGLVELLESPDADEHCRSLTGATPSDCGNRVLIMPGTGLGSAAIIDLGPKAPPRWHVVPCEAQHVPATTISRSDARILNRVGDRLGRQPSWEDLVSGRGLVALYDATDPESGTHPDRINAETVAARARDGDAGAATALRAFYHFAGGFAQMLALAYDATGGVFLSGASTAANVGMVTENDFAWALRENSAMGHRLVRIDAFAVTCELNLRGARRVAQRLR